MLRNISLLFSALAFSLPLVAAQPVSARPLATPDTSVHQRDGGGEAEAEAEVEIELKFCFKLEVEAEAEAEADGAACHDSCSALADKGCDMQLSGRSKQNPRTIAACEQDFVAQCQTSCQDSLDIALAEGTNRSGGGESEAEADADVEIYFCIELKVDVEAEAESD